MHEVLVNRLGGLSLPRKSVVRLTDRPDMTLDVYRGRKTTNQQINREIVGPRNSSADERKRRTVEYRNGVLSSTNSYSNVVIPEGITNKILVQRKYAIKSSK